MEKIIRENKKERETIYNFNGTADFYEHISKTPVGNYTRNRIDLEYDFETTLSHLANGWQTESNKINDIKKDLLQSEIEGFNYNVEYDVFGDFVNVDDYLAGIPECMGTITHVSRPKEGLTLIVSPNYSWVIKDKTIKLRGAAIMAIIESLENDYEIRFISTNRSSLGKMDNGKLDIIEMNIEIDMQNEYSRDVLAFIISHPCFCRHLFFSLQELHANKDNMRHCSYGALLNSEQLVKDNQKHGKVYYFGKVQNKDEEIEWDTKAHAVETINKVISAVNKLD